MSISYAQINNGSLRFQRWPSVGRYGCYVNRAESHLIISMNTRGVNSFAGTNEVHEGKKRARLAVSSTALWE